MRTLLEPLSDISSAKHSRTCRHGVHVSFRHLGVARPLKSLRGSGCDELLPKSAKDQSTLCQGHNRQLRRARRLVCTASFSDTLVGVGLFFTPSILAVVYAFFKGKGNVKDGLSKMLTEVSQGYFQPDVGGENIPIAQGELSDLAGDEPLFKALYQWCDNTSK